MIVAHVAALEHRVVRSLRNVVDDLLCLKYQMRSKIVLPRPMLDACVPVPGRLEYHDSNWK